jgi:hypothetical protein
VWNGNYLKCFYDIPTTSGKTQIGCWPNAGKMNAADGTGRSWKPHQVAMIRRSIKEPPTPGPDRDMNRDIVSGSA